MGLTTKRTGLNPGWVFLTTDGRVVWSNEKPLWDEVLTTPPTYRPKPHARSTDITCWYIGLPDTTNMKAKDCLWEITFCLETKDG